MARTRPSDHGIVLAFLREGPCLEGNRAASRSPGHASFSTARRRIESIAAQAGRMMVEFVRSLLLLLTREGEAIHERQRADFLWRKLLRRTPQQRLMLIEEAREYPG